MPSKSRHSHRKKSFKVDRKAGPAVPASAVTKPAVSTPYRPATASRPAPAAARSSPAAVMQYPYIKKELMWIGIIAAIILIILVVLYLVL